MLDELAVLQPKNINTDITIRADEAGPVSMDGHEVAICDHSADITLGVGEVPQEAVDVGSQGFHAIFGGGGVLDVGVTDVAGDRAVDVTVEVRCLVEGQDGLLVLLTPDRTGRKRRERP
jgi:hypothetical protein